MLGVLYIYIAFITVSLVAGRNHDLGYDKFRSNMATVILFCFDLHKLLHCAEFDVPTVVVTKRYLLGYNALLC
jgi:hypothetical protein